MNRFDLIRWAMDITGQRTEMLVKDMTDAALLQPTPGKGNGGNHAMWNLGHLTLIESSLANILLGEPNELEKWGPLFGMGTQPTTDASKYPPFEEVVAKFRELRAKNLKMLDKLGDEGLDRKPANVPPGFEKAMTTFGQTILLIAIHNFFHCGEIAVDRKAAGRQPLN